jgi:hypothetical protein
MNANQVQLSFTKDEVQFMQQVLGELPTKTGAYLILVNIQKQLQAQEQPAKE